MSNDNPGITLDRYEPLYLLVDLIHEPVGSLLRSASESTVKWTRFLFVHLALSYSPLTKEGEPFESEKTAFLIMT